MLTAPAPTWRTSRAPKSLEPSKAVSVGGDEEGAFRIRDVGDDDRLLGKDKGNLVEGRSIEGGKEADAAAYGVDGEASQARERPHDSQGVSGADVARHCPDFDFSHLGTLFDS
mgnify:CR=1 FL=1